MAKLLIIGIGNPLRQDDGLGHFAAKRLADRFADDSRVTVIDCHQPTPELAEQAAESDEVLFIDAATAGAPGELKIRSLPDNDEKDLFLAHQLSPNGLLELSERLYGQRPRAQLLTITGKHFGIGEGLSIEVVHGLNRIEEEVAGLVADGLGAG